MFALKKFKVAAVQAAPIFLNRSASVEKACRIIREAGAEGARIIGFPEGFIPAHPHWFHFEPAINRRAMEFNTQLWNNALEVPSPEAGALCDAAKQAGAYVVMGCCERLPGGSGSLYNSQLFIGPNGEVLGKHQKLVPTHAERVVHAQGQRKHGIVCVPTELGGSLGGLICGEHFNTLARFALIAKGELFHVGSWPANFAAGHHQMMFEAKNFSGRAHAFEGKLFVINAAGVVSEEIKQILCPDPGREDVFGSMGGGSAIIGPDGNYIAGPARDKEEILYGEFDLSNIVRGKVLHDICGHYQRPDIFTLILNEEDPQLILDSSTQEGRKSSEMLRLENKAHQRSAAVAEGSNSDFLMSSSEKGRIRSPEGK
ncbi:MAG: carbon-nitrogen hydrolase family protein [Pseudomonadota bacterium]